MKNSSPIVWVEADRPPARYFINSIKIHQELFPSRKKIVVTNSKYIKRYKKLPVEIVQIEKIKPSVYSTKFDSISKNWTHNRQQLSYWKNTTKRFFYLYDALSHLKIEKCIHIESDNILFTTIYLDKKLKNRHSKIAYPKQCDGLGCASILLVGNLNVLSKFLDFICVNWQIQDSTDMTLLGKFEFKSKFGEYLPSGDIEQLKHDTFLDAGTIGRYFLGGDARNYRFPTSRRGLFENKTGSFNPIHWHLVGKVKNDVNLKNFITGQSLKLANIHIHSKRIPNNFSKLQRMMIRESNRPKSKLWEIGRLDFLVLTERFASKLGGKLGFTRSEVRLR